MKIAAQITMLTLVGITHQARSGEDVKLSMTVYVQAGIGGDPRLPAMCSRAQSIASEMFAAAGVHIRWRAGQPKTLEQEQPILIDITSNTPITLHPRALAYAQVFEGVHVRIFYDRVRDAACYDRVRDAACPGATTALLAHVLVHEITHLLEGMDRHSEEGVMKAHWTDRDLAWMAHKPLPFDPKDVRLIQNGLANRSSAIKRVLAAAKAVHAMVPAR